MKEVVTLKRFIYFFCLLILLTACSHTDQSTESDQTETADHAATPEIGVEMEQTEEHIVENRAENSSSEDRDNTGSDNDLPELDNRKIIYNANLHVETSHFNKTVNFLEDQTKHFQGYIVSSNQSTRGEEENKFGSMTIRVPSARFQEFIATMEEGDLKILDRSITGEDVTEQYVDLTARLEAKEVVEGRLLTFMEEAEKTEDLLKISSDLAEVQEEIEQLTGKINYLENQSDHATVVIEITESNVKLPDVQDESLNTWEKTKDQFLTSIQFLLSVLSAVFVFIVGNAPVLLLLGVIAFVIFLRLKKLKAKK